MLQERFNQLDIDRSGVLSRAEECAKLTLPYIFPEEGTDINTDLYTPHQSVGARGVNNLASKLLLTLFPPDGGFFTLSLDEAVKVQLDKQQIETVEEILAIVETAILKYINTIPNLRSTLFEVLKHLIITGNAAIWLTTEGIKMYNLRDFVVVRDKSDNLVELILRETIDIDVLPENIQKELLKKTPSAVEFDEDNPQATLYTAFVRKGKNQWETWQEIEGIEVPNSRQTLNKLPVFVLRWTNTEYGRGLVEQHLGDLRTLEKLTQAITEGSLMAAKTVFMVDPSGFTNPTELANAENGDIIEGRAQEVSVLQLQKYPDFQIAYQKAVDLEQRLNQIFLIFAPRQAERVTAEEIRRITEQLEQLLGGVYTLLTEELQKPFIEYVYNLLEKRGEIPKMPRDDIKIVITTGFEVLSRTAQLNKLALLLQMIGPIPEAIQMINWDNYLKQVLNNLNINPKGLVKTQEQLIAEQQALLQQQLAVQAGQAAIQQAVNNQNA